MKLEKGIYHCAGSWYAINEDQHVVNLGFDLACLESYHIAKLEFVIAWVPQTHYSDAIEEAKRVYAEKPTTKPIATKRFPRGVYRKKSSGGWFVIDDKEHVVNRGCPLASYMSSTQDDLDWIASWPEGADYKDIIKHYEASERSIAKAVSNDVAIGVCFDGSSKVYTYRTLRSYGAGFKRGDKVKVVDGVGAGKTVTVQWVGGDSVPGSRRVVPFITCGTKVDTLIVDEVIDVFKHERALAKLKLGDRVRITGKCPNRDGGWDNSWAERMDKSIGKEGVVQRLSSAGVSIDIGDGFDFPAHMLEKIEVKPAPKYVVGDRVRVLREADDYEADWSTVWLKNPMNQLIGKTCTIRNIDRVDDQGIELEELLGYYYPPFVLEKVEPSALETGTALHKYLEEALRTGVVPPPVVNGGPVKWWKALDMSKVESRALTVDWAMYEQDWTSPLLSDAEMAAQLQMYEYATRFSERYGYGRGGSNTPRSASHPAKKEIPMQVKIETITYVTAPGINQVPVSNLSDDAVFEAIAAIEKEIKRLDAIDAKPEKLAARIDTLKQNVIELGKIVDARDSK